MTERETDNLRVQWLVERTVHRERSKFQEIAVVDTVEFGRMLLLDGIIQTSLRDEFVYHEMLAHVPLFLHPRPERVLVIGGGDGGTVREVLKHPEVRRVHLVEIDERVIAVSRQYLPELASSFDDPRVEIRIDDGIEYVKRHRNAYDVVLVDSSDPLGPAVGLFTSEFYGNVAEVLRKDGILAVQSESYIFSADLVQSVYRAIGEHFPSVFIYTANVPTYSVGPWTFTLGSKRFLDSVAPRRANGKLRTRYYTPEIHRAAFVLPRFVQELLSEQEDEAGTGTRGA